MMRAGKRGINNDAKTIETSSNFNHFLCLHYIAMHSIAHDGSERKRKREDDLWHCHRTSTKRIQRINDDRTILL